MTTELVFDYQPIDDNAEPPEEFGSYGDWFDDWDDRATEPFETEAEALAMKERLERSYKGPDADGVGMVIRVWTYGQGHP